MSELEIPSELELVKDLISRFAKPCRYLNFVQTSSSLPFGSSKFGGSPDVPPDFKWPTRRARELGFILQISLSDIIGNPTDEGGWLLFFYDTVEQPGGFDPSDLSGFFVCRVDEGAEVVRAASAGAPLLKEAAIAFRDGISIPHPKSSDFKKISNGASWDDALLDVYYDFRHRMIFDQLKSAPSHMLGGYSDNIQDDLQLEAEMVSHGIDAGAPLGYADPRVKKLERSAASWQLLLQLDSDRRQGLDWSGGGMLYYMHQPDYEPARRYWAEIQSG